MAGEPLPPVDLAPPIPHDTTLQQRLDLWIDLMNTCEQFLLAGLRREIGPDGDLEAAHRRWYEQHMEEHDREKFEGLLRYSQRRGGNG